MDYAVDLRDYPEEVVKKFLAGIEKVSTIKWRSGCNPTQFIPNWDMLATQDNDLIQCCSIAGYTVLTRDQFIAKMAELYPKKKQDIREYCKEHRCWAMKASGAHKPKGWYYADQKPALDIARSSWVHNYMHDSIALDESKFTFPDVPWDKSLIAPDGSMPLMGKKEESKVTEFITGHWYKLQTAGKISNDFMSDDMNIILDGNPRICIRGQGASAQFEGQESSWAWYVRDWVEVPAPKKKDDKPRRGDPIFVWDDGYDDTIPATVMYFHHPAGSGVVVFSESLEGKSGIYYDHYREFDASLVGVPRREWP